MLRVDASDADAQALRAAWYRWYTVGLSREHVKVGPVAVTWYRWRDGRLRLEGWWLMRVRLFLFGGLLR